MLKLQWLRNGINIFSWKINFSQLIDRRKYYFKFVNMEKWSKTVNREVGNYNFRIKKIKPKCRIFLSLNKKRYLCITFSKRG